MWGPRIQPGERAETLVRFERRQAAWTALVYGGVAAATTLLVRAGLLPVTTALPSPGTLALEVVVFVLIFDFYFYGAHRLMHTRALARIHAVHHRSRAPRPLTAVSFHPLEALLLLIYMPLAMAVLPMHLASALVGGSFLAGSILLAHCGREIFPRWWHETPILRWIATPLVHDTHHAACDVNFSATTSIPDRLFGTYRLDAAGFWSRVGPVGEPERRPLG